MIELQGKDRVVAKICDFTKKIEVTESDRKTYELGFRDEYYRLGLVRAG